MDEHTIIGFIGIFIIAYYLYKFLVLAEDVHDIAKILKERKDK